MEDGIAYANGPDYGAAGNGIADDTAEIQAALDSGAKVVRLAPGSTYIVSQAGTKTIQTVAHRYCLLIPDGVYLDLNGSTLKLSDSQNAAVVMNATAGTTQNTDLGVGNGVIDGNQANQTSPGAGDMPCVFFYDVMRPTVKDLRAKNVRQYAGRFLACYEGYFNNLRCDDSDGDGWSFGVNGTAGENRVFRSFIDNIYSENCTNGGYGSLQGNPALFTVVECSVGKVVGKNCGGGIKIQDSSSDSTFGQLLFESTSNGSTNSGTKIQGNAGASLFPTNISVGQIISKSCEGESAHIADADHINIGSILAYGGALDAAVTRDVYIDNVDYLNIGSIQSIEPSGIGVVVDDTTDNYHIGSILVKDMQASTVGVQVQTTGYGTIDSVAAIDTAGTPQMVTGFKVSSTGAKGKLGSFRTNLSNDTAVEARCMVSVVNLNYEIGKITLGSTDALEGIVTLSNGATSTSVTCGHIYDVFVGTSTTDHYFTPIILVLPFNSSAGALVGSSQFRTLVTRNSSGTGFSIAHASAGATDYVYWKVIGWKVSQREQL
jgi:hypothetical protein